jgi:hypothetical protein
MDNKVPGRENPYEAPQTKSDTVRASGDVPTWRKVVGGAILFSILGPFLVPPLIYLAWLLLTGTDLK